MFPKFLVHGGFHVEEVVRKARRARGGDVLRRVTVACYVGLVVLYHLGRVCFASGIKYSPDHE